MLNPSTALAATSGQWRCPTFLSGHKVLLDRAAKEGSFEAGLCSSTNPKLLTHRMVTFRDLCMWQLPCLFWTEVTPSILTKFSLSCETMRYQCPSLCHTEALALPTVSCATWGTGVHDLAETSLAREGLPSGRN